MSLGPPHAPDVQTAAEPPAHDAVAATIRADSTTSSRRRSPSPASGKSATSDPNRPKHPIPNTEISVDNIVEGGRRKRATFDSSVSY